MTLDPARKNVLLLALCQALGMTGNTVLATVAALIGQALADDKSLATFPLALQQLATMGATIPASLLMQRLGRRVGFQIGVLVGMAGSVLGVYAISSQSFPLFCLATILFGSFNGFAGFYRFAAAEAAHEQFRSQAISLVIAGGVIAALVGPALATWSRVLMEAQYAGSLVVIITLQLVALLLLTWVAMPRASVVQQTEPVRPLMVIARQPKFIVAVLGSMLGYGTMALVMTATPLAMVAASHPFDAAASVIQWHVLGMFAPSFVTGFLIARFGVLNIILCGGVLNAFCIAINLLGTGFLEFWAALLLLGIGWNFMFVGSTTLLTEAYAPAERAKSQAMHDFLMFGFVAFATFLSGRLLYDFGWDMVNYAGIPMNALAIAAVLWLRQRRDLAPVSPD
ncbi:MFS transporter [Leptolyngbya sp. FACHB-261]|uniref:MFS transporter n=1 Tax=Leptolyngbya sp. FACHB-261 TaxID=2692806 RepID=UPI00168976DC|nr:MFS transporter [Leptolyngbya sp. FACHB-261]MBD2104552.1 MFS transporter [Leptolyngbya sp. FACHB-261]